MQGSGSAVFATHHLRLVGTPVSWGRRRSAAGSLALLPQNGAKWRSSQWLENSAQAEIEVPLEVAWALWEDRTLIPRWMPWITSVVVLDDDPRMSRWTLSTFQFNRQVSI